MVELQNQSDTTLRAATIVRIRFALMTSAALLLEGSAAVAAATYAVQAADAWLKGGELDAPRLASAEKVFRDRYELTQRGEAFVCGIGIALTSALRGIEAGTEDGQPRAVSAAYWGLVHVISTHMDAWLTADAFAPGGSTSPSACAADQERQGLAGSPSGAAQV